MCILLELKLVSAKQVLTPVESTGAGIGNCSKVPIESNGAGLKELKFLYCQWDRPTLKKALGEEIQNTQVKENAF